MVRSSVDLPAPDRPITPTKPPGAMENDALSTAALVPKRHVKPSTTSMSCSSTQLPPPLAPVSNSYVTAAPHCGDRPHLRFRHVSVMLLSSSPSMTCTLNPASASPMETSLAGKMLSIEPTIDPIAKLQQT